ncbi:MAG TPA: hypothetical protein PLS81_00945, partial [Deltaproteobacteria bacterium]|nr:hypothetical protein [Deltaproteobacteria bacterium]
MKRMMFVWALVVLAPTAADAAGYVFATYGNGGDVGEPSYGIELGAVFLSPYHPTGGAFSVGVGVSIADTDEDPPASPEKKYNDGSEQEVFASVGAELSPAFFGVAGLGYSTQDVVKPYDSSDTENHATGMLGVRCVVRGFD